MTADVSNLRCYFKTPGKWVFWYHRLSVPTLPGTKSPTSCTGSGRSITELPTRSFVFVFEFYCRQIFFFVSYTVPVFSLSTTTNMNVSVSLKDFSCCRINLFINFNINRQMVVKWSIILYNAFCVQYGACFFSFFVVVSFLTHTNISDYKSVMHEYICSSELYKVSDEKSTQLNLSKKVFTFFTLRKDICSSLPTKFNAGFANNGVQLACKMQAL